jgi:hypothetical protein
VPGVHIGWQRWPDSPCGRWLLRRYVGGKYTITEIGKADDAREADGRTVLDYAQARHVAGTMLASPGKGKTIRMTVRQAFALYLEHKATLDQDVTNVRNRGTVHILPSLGDLVIEDLDAARLRRWLADLAAQTGQKRPTRDGKLQWPTSPSMQRVFGFIAITASTAAASFSRSTAKIATIKPMFASFHTGMNPEMLCSLSSAAATRTIRRSSKSGPTLIIPAGGYGMRAMFLWCRIVCRNY